MEVEAPAPLVRSRAWHKRKRFAMHPQFTISEIQRFWSHVDISGECWTWTASRQWNGYGVFVLGRPSTPRKVSAHRFSWALHFGEIPVGLQVLHHCDNPPCVRPDHLFTGTNLDNRLDSVAKGRQARGATHGMILHPERRACGQRHGAYTHPEAIPVGEARWSAKLTEAQVLAIRTAAAGGATVLALMRTYSMGRHAIRAIITRETWRHI